MKMQEFGGLWFDPREIRYVKVHPPCSISTDNRWRVYLELNSEARAFNYPAWSNGYFASEHEARAAAVDLVNLREAAIAEEKVS